MITDVKSAIEQMKRCIDTERDGCVGCDYNYVETGRQENGITAKQHVLEVLERVPRWIPLEERYPKYNEVGDACLVIMNGEIGGTTYVDGFEFVEFDDDGGFMLSVDEKLVPVNSFVTHWLKIPDPPEREENTCQK